ncbi:hypothetical protein PCASD_07929 [Puccinia coronata f. sp. avenae]|uniref:Secreted protein n=1 Tax=Puccinia coronata f. sp. avenae TaxID=200324 RepID=A0A2N5UTF7_9BASI|nr:hypothetical protein PCASD_07929 [Puccinia coronata f. sp. avenae]
MMRSYIIALGSLMITVIVNIDPASAFNCANIKAPNGKTPAHAAACKLDSNYYRRADYISKQNPRAAMWRLLILKPRTRSAPLYLERN